MQAGEGAHLVQKPGAKGRFGSNFPVPGRSREGLQSGAQAPSDKRQDTFSLIAQEVFSRQDPRLSTKH